MLRLHVIRGGGGRDKDTQRGRDGGRENLTAKEKKFSSSAPRERAGGGREGGRGRDRGTKGPGG